MSDLKQHKRKITAHLSKTVEPTLGRLDQKVASFPNKQSKKEKIDNTMDVKKSKTKTDMKKSSVDIKDVKTNGKINEKTVNIKLPYHGESTCTSKKASGTRCEKKAYYVSPSNKAVCGWHREGSKKQLPKDPNAKKKAAEKYKEHLKTVDAAQKANFEAKRPGTITIHKLRMRATLDQIPGVENIRPNHYEAGATDALGLSELSPMSMGPLSDTIMSVENRHQSCKVFPQLCRDGGDETIASQIVDLEKSLPDLSDDVDQVMEAFQQIDELLENQHEPLPVFYDVRRSMQADKTPYRHQAKFIAGHQHEFKCEIPTRENAPLYSECEGKRYSYIQSRQLYCNEYETFALKSKQFKKLKSNIAAGRNIRICGYDGYTPTQSLAWHYLDRSKPFGHELVLYSLLTINDASQYPWRLFNPDT